MTKRNLQIFSYLLITVFLTLGLLISFQSLLAAWTAPLASPPTCATGNPGCDAPINMGSLPQIKYGSLKVNMDDILATGLAVYGKVGIGTITPGAALEVVGDIISKGTSWTARSTPVTNVWTSVAYGNGIFVAVSDYAAFGQVMTSSDGINWTARTAADNSSWVSVAYGNGLFVAVADAVSAGGSYRVMTSPDGITWTGAIIPEANAWHSVTYGNGIYVAVAGDGGRRVMTSPDGAIWTPVTASIATNWTSVTYGNGIFVAVGTDNGLNLVMTSPDGAIWTPRTAIEANQWKSVTYGNGLFVAVSTNGTNRVMTSPNGISWTARTAAQANQWKSVTYGNGLFVAVASDGANRVMTSPDGANWTARTAAEANSWQSVTYGNGLFVAVPGNSINRVMTSGKQELNVASLPNGGGSQWHNFGSSIYYNTGNVGIGTNNPFSPSSITRYLNISSSGGSAGVNLSAGSEDYEVANVAGSLWFIDDNSGKIVLQNTTGNVGIGTTSPGYKLAVAGDINFTGNLRKNGILFGNSQWTTSESDIYYNSGKVGIGTSTPKNTLHVDGRMTLADAKSGNFILYANSYWDSLLNTNKVLNDGYTGRIGFSKSTGNWYFQNSQNFGLHDSQIDPAFEYKFAIARNGSIGIGTTEPRTAIEIVSGGDILAVGEFGQGWTEVNLSAGTRLFWYPRKAAFRAGYVNGAQWNNDNIGNYSVAFGQNNNASGDNSFAAGQNNFAGGSISFVGGGSNNSSDGAHSFVGGGRDNHALGGYSVVSGGGPATDVIPTRQSIAQGDYSTISGGQGNQAIGLSAAVSGGKLNIAQGQYSFVGGGFDNGASGNYSAAFGAHTTAQAYASAVFGQYNVISGTVDSWVATDPLFIVGNGTAAGSPSNALTVLKNGNVGIGTAAPAQKLSVNNGSIGLWNNNDVNFYTNDGTALKGFMGLGRNNDLSLVAKVNGNWLRIGANNGGIAFFPDNTVESADTPKVFINASGNVGIGTTNPQAALDMSSGGIRLGGVTRTSWPAATSQWADVAGGINYAGGDVGIGTTFQYDKVNAKLLLSSPDFPTQQAQIYAVKGLNTNYNDLHIAGTNAAGNSYLFFGDSGRKFYQTDFTNAGKVVMPSFWVNEQSGIQTISNYGIRMFNYYGIEVLGNRHTAANPSAIACQESVCDAASLMVIAGINNLSVNVPALALYGYSGGQTANIMEIKNSSNAVQAVFNASGFLGIGTAAPNKLVHLKTASGNAEIEIQSADSPYWGIYQDDETDELRFWNLDDQIIFTKDGSAANTTGVWAVISDARLKEMIQPLEGSLDKITSLQGVSFYWKDKSRGEGLQRGFIAQDVEKVFPEWVKTDQNGYKSLEKQGIEAFIVEAIKELAAALSNLAAKVEDLFKKFLVHDERIQALERQNLEQQKQIDDLKMQIQAIQSK